jgi:hypothetical protein
MFGLFHLGLDAWGFGGGGGRVNYSPGPPPRLLLGRGGNISSRKKIS